jgi:methyl-accepting chemotaxis protein
MDEVTQQNSALVEENAASAKTLEHQAKIMDGRIAFFHVEDDARVTTSAAGERDAGSGEAQNAAAPRPMRLPFLRRQGNRI